LIHWKRDGLTTPSGVLLAKPRKNWRIWLKRPFPGTFFIQPQSSRAVILFEGQSEKFWDLTKQELAKIVPPAEFGSTAAKLDMFAAGSGTVLFYEDQAVVEGMARQFPAYADNFPVWSEQAAGMAQYAVWLALADIGVGASLQHYNPLPDEAARQTWDIPASWKLRAQMPFGSKLADVAEKAFMDDAQRFIVRGGWLLCFSQPGLFWNTLCYRGIGGAVFLEPGDVPTVSRSTFYSLRIGAGYLTMVGGVEELQNTSFPWPCTGGHDFDITERWSTKIGTLFVIWV
jgi:predicted oxidoreductase (fatty acid repression mutant protein)